MSCRIGRHVPPPGDQARREQDLRVLRRGNRREGGGVRQRVVAYPGRLDVQGAQRVMVWLRGLALLAPRAVAGDADEVLVEGSGGEAVLRAWSFWGLDAVLQEAGLTIEEVRLVTAMVANRCVDPGSKLAKRHLEPGSLVLFDLSSSYVEGRTCPLVAFGYNRDKKRGKPQITHGLLTNRAGCPVAIEVFRGNQSDPLALREQVDRLRQTYGFTDLVVVGDRGMITKTRIADLERAGLNWLTALRAPEIQALHRQGLIPLTLFDEKNLLTIEDPERPGQRLVVCRNPLVAEERKRKREELLQSAERELGKIAARVQAGRLKDAGAIGIAVGRVFARFPVRKHFRLQIEAGAFRFERDTASIEREAAWDGVYVVCTNAPQDKLSDEEAVEGYRSLRHVEQAFRTMKTTLLELRPIFHRLEDQVRAHAFLGMLAYYVVWHMRRALEPLLDQADGFLSLQAVLRQLETIDRQTMVVQGGYTFQLVTEPDEHQRRIYELLDVPVPA